MLLFFAVKMVKSNTVLQIQDHTLSTQHKSTENCDKHKFHRHTASLILVHSELGWKITDQLFYCKNPNLYLPVLLKWKVICANYFLGSFYSFFHRKYVPPLTPSIVSMFVTFSTPSNALMCSCAPN